jgi:hypothetical protein
MRRLREEKDRIRAGWNGWDGREHAADRIDPAVARRGETDYFPATALDLAPKRAPEKAARPDDDDLHGVTPRST